jgi:hypothetical protein
MVIPYLIWRATLICLGALSYLVHILSLFLLPPQFTIVTSSLFYDIFVAWHDLSVSLLSPLYLLKTPGVFRLYVASDPLSFTLCLLCVTWWFSHCLEKEETDCSFPFECRGWVVSHDSIDSRDDLVTLAGGFWCFCLQVLSTLCVTRWSTSSPST